MHASIIFTTILSLTASTFARNIVKARAPQDAAPQDAAPQDAAPQAAAPQEASSQGFAPTSYTLVVTSDQTGTRYFSSDPNGNVAASYSASDIVRYVAVRNPADDAACFARDAWGNQVRAFGGEDQTVDQIEFVENDGRQIKSVSCSTY